MNLEVLAVTCELTLHVMQCNKSFASIISFSKRAHETALFIDEGCASQRHATCLVLNSWQHIGEEMQNS